LLDVGVLEIVKSQLCKQNKMEGGPVIDAKVTSQSFSGRHGYSKDALASALELAKGKGCIPVLFRC
jgi:hypothetical protein